MKPRHSISFFNSAWNFSSCFASTAITNRSCCKPLVWIKHTILDSVTLQHIALFGVHHISMKAQFITNSQINSRCRKRYCGNKALQIFTCVHVTTWWKRTIPNGSEVFTWLAAAPSPVTGNVNDHELNCIHCDTVSCQKVKFYKSQPITNNLRKNRLKQTTSDDTHETENQIHHLTTFMRLRNSLNMQVQIPTHWGIGTLQCKTND